MKEIFLIFAFLSHFFTLFAQKRDNTWIMGYYGGEPGPKEDTIFGVQRLLFDNHVPTITKFFQAKFNINEANSSISDKDGNLLFFFNGVNLFNKNLLLTKGEDNLNLNPEHTGGNISRIQQGIFLPFPNDENKTILCYKYEVFEKLNGGNRAFVKEFNIAIIDNKGKDGLGEILVKKQNLVSDTLDLGKITATKHANGRDWWVISQRYESNQYYKFLIDHKGGKVNDLQEIGIDKSTYVGQAVFSPDGKFYINHDYASFLKDPHLTIFDFDRCSGQLSNCRNIFFDKEISIGGCAVSPNSRFLYVGFDSKMLQYDLWAKDVAASKKIIGEYDGFLFLNGFGTNFFLAQLAPDGKIYISTSGSSPYLHVINYPDREGSACGFKVRGLELPFVNGWGIPNHPNYRLGALKGSPCDSLSVAVQEVREEDFKVFPNPANDILHIQLPLSTPSATILLRDIQGRLLKDMAAKGDTQLDISDLYNGLIFIEIWVENRRIATKKVIIIN